jgi:hypothetical protein
VGVYGTVPGSSTIQHFERIAIMVDSAGIIQVGPMSTTIVEDFATALDMMF